MLTSWKSCSAPVTLSNSRTNTKGMSYVLLIYVLIILCSRTGNPQLLRCGVMLESMHVCLKSNDWASLILITWWKSVMFLIKLLMSSLFWFLSRCTRLSFLWLCISKIHELGCRSDYIDQAFSSSQSRVIKFLGQIHWWYGTCQPKKSNRPFMPFKY